MRRCLVTVMLVSACAGSVACIRIEQQEGDAQAPVSDASLDAGSVADVRADGGSDAGMGDAFDAAGHRYRAVCDAPLNWNAAKLAAEKEGGHLVTIRNEAEHNLVFALINPTTHPECWSNAGSGVWTGGVRANNDAPWTWVTGEPWSYTRWESGEPNGVRGRENNAMYVKTGSWYDSEEPLKSNYVIEWD
jgi:hypothetical protein